MVVVAAAVGGDDGIEAVVAVGVTQGGRTAEGACAAAAAAEAEPAAGAGAMGAGRACWEKGCRGIARGR